MGPKARALCQVCRLGHCRASLLSQASARAASFLFSLEGPPRDKEKRINLFMHIRWSKSLEQIIGINRRALIYRSDVGIRKKTQNLKKLVMSFHRMWITFFVVSHLESMFVSMIFKCMTMIYNIVGFGFGYLTPVWSK